jgi:hypothetical protein
MTLRSSGDTYRRLALGLLLAAVAATGGVVGYLVGTSRAPLMTSAGDDPILDGTAPLDPSGLAELAQSRAAAGARWLADVARDDGSFFYFYDPETDTYEPDEYNAVRHAGTTYSLFASYGVTRDPAVLEAAEGAVRYIDDSSVAVEGRPGRAYLYQGQMKLGGQALALVALLERRRVLSDTSRDRLIQDLADFMTAMELPDEPGRYYQSYLAQSDELSLEPDSDYYPGEALLAFTRLAQQFPSASYLDHAKRAGRYLIYQRDGDIPAAGQVPREDQWLAMALAELYRLDAQQEYRDVTYLQAESMIANQHGPEGPPMRVGASSLRNPINYTSTATKAEALVAAWALARFADDASAEERFAAAARRSLQFQLRVQYTAENTQLFPRPEAAIGAWGKDGLDPWIRIDFVQHNISGLLGMWAMTVNDDIPIASPID